MFSLRAFIKNGFLDAVGRLADYQIILNAAGWLDKGVLMEGDLVEIQSAIDARNAAQSALSAPVEDAPSGEETPIEDTLSGDEAPDEDTPSGDETPDEDAPSGDEDALSGDGTPAGDAPA